MSAPINEIPPSIAKCHNDWIRAANTLQRIAWVLGAMAVVSSIAVTAVSGVVPDPVTRIFAAVSAGSISLLSFFQIQKKISDYWAGWKYLNGQLVLYQVGKLSLEDLVADYQKAEILVGTPELKDAALK